MPVEPKLPSDVAIDSRFMDVVQKFSANSVQGIKQTISNALSIYGLKHASYISLNLPTRDRNDPFIIATYSDEWIRHYRDHRYYNHDPVITQGFASILPLSWSEFDLSPIRVRKLFGEARDCGVGRNGTTFPIRGRHGEQALFSITSDDKDAEWNRKKLAFARDFQLISYPIHRMVLKTEGIAMPEVKLAPREIECLRLIASGNTQSEAAQLAGLKPNTVRFYLETAREKLEAVNNIHAVAKAMSLNLIAISS